MFSSLKYYKIQTQYREICIGTSFPYFLCIKCIWGYMKCDFIPDVNFKHTPHEKVSSLRL